jgi:hypothetical protein
MSSKAIFLTVLLGMLISVPVVAQQDPPKAKTARFGTAEAGSLSFQDYLYGVVKSISKTEMVLDKTALGDDQVLQLSPKTKFIQDGKPSSLENLKVDDKVWVDKKKNKAGDMLAVKVFTGIEPTKKP